MDELQNPRWLTPETAESAYNSLTSYRFARRYVEGRSVADISWDRVGYGTRLLAETAGSVIGLTNLAESLEPASTIYPASNVSYQKADLPYLPYPDDYFDVAVAFEVIEKLENPKSLLLEAKRVLKQNGIFILSTPDKQTHSNDRNHRDPTHKREMYMPEFRELLESNFERVRLYRQGVAAGGFVFGSGDTLAGASVETTGYSSTYPSLRGEPPRTHFVMAVCSDSELPENEGPFLLLDDDRRIFDEVEDYREDVELLREEIQRMQKTEVQAFQDALRIERSEVAYLRAELERHQAQMERYEAQVKHHEARAERYEARIQRHQAEAERYKNQAQNYEARMQHYEARTERHEARIKHHQAETERYKNQAQNYESRVRNLESHNRKLKGRLLSIESSRVWRLLSLYRRLRGGSGAANRAG